MKRILFLHTSAVLGGSEKAFLDLIVNLPPDLQERSLVLLPEEGPLFEELIEKLPKVQVMVLPFPKHFSKSSRKFPLRSLWWTLRDLGAITGYYRRLREIILKNDIDLIYSNGIKSHLISGFVGRQTGLKWILHLQDYFPSFAFVRLFLKYFASAPERIISNSQDVLNKLWPTLPSSWRSTDSCIAHNAVDLRIFETAVRAQPPTLTIAMIGILTPWKGQDLFLKALSLVRKSNPEIQFQAWIVGDEIYRTAGEVGFKDTLIQMTRDLSLDSHIVFKGFIKNIDSVLLASDIVCHCSRKPEPFGKIIVEAMAAGCSVIAARAGGASEIFVDQEEGLYFTPNSAEDLARQILRLAQNPTLRQQLGKNAKLRASKDYSAISFARKIEPLILKTIDGSP